MISRIIAILCQWGSLTFEIMNRYSLMIPFSDTTCLELETWLKITKWLCICGYSGPLDRQVAVKLKVSHFEHIRSRITLICAIIVILHHLLLAKHRRTLSDFTTLHEELDYISARKISGILNYCRTVLRVGIVRSRSITKRCHGTTMSIAEESCRHQNITSIVVIFWLVICMITEYNNKL